ncbi:MAG TPA: fibronectin type III domain-containing protein, partial [Bdellovibrionota bacterium]|nr:fibronectin type III domain-containing protein [Bdellovibrionota bacterium]
LDGAAMAPCTSPASYSGLANGSHTFRVQAIDTFGSVDSVGASYPWTVDTVAPTIVSITPATTSTSITISWVTSEPTSSKVQWGVGVDTSHTVPEDSNFVTSHSVKLTGLSPNTLYSFIVSGHDRAGNAYTSTRQQIRTNN